MKNLPEDVLGLTTKKELNKCKWILKIKTLLEWLNLRFSHLEIPVSGMLIKKSKQSENQKKS